MNWQSGGVLNITDIVAGTKEAELYKQAFEKQFGVGTGTRLNFIGTQSYPTDADSRITKPQFTIVHVNELISKGELQNGSIVMSEALHHKGKFTIGNMGEMTQDTGFMGIKGSTGITVKDGKTLTLMGSQASMAMAVGADTRDASYVITDAPMALENGTLKLGHKALSATEGTLAAVTYDRQSSVNVENGIYTLASLKGEGSLNLSSGARTDVTGELSATQVTNAGMLTVAGLTSLGATPEAASTYAAPKSQTFVNENGATANLTGGLVVNDFATVKNKTGATINAGAVTVDTFGVINNYEGATLAYASVDADGIVRNLGTLNVTGTYAIGDEGETTFAGDTKVGTLSIGRTAKTMLMARDGQEAVLHNTGKTYADELDLVSGQVMVEKDSILAGKSLKNGAVGSDIIVSAGGTFGFSHDKSSLENALKNYTGSKADKAILALSTDLHFGQGGSLTVGSVNDAKGTVNLGSDALLLLGTTQLHGEALLNGESAQHLHAEDGAVIAMTDDLLWGNHYLMKGFDAASTDEILKVGVLDKDVIQVFTNGNNDRANPYHRALYPYFNPEAEAQWIAIAGLRQMDKNTDPDNYKLEANFNEAGYAKYWTLSGPGQNGYTANKAGNNVYGSYSGTSMAAPFISGAFGVLASRYQDMSAVQVREVLLTTANHKNADGSDMIGWANADGKTPAEGEVSDRMGWGVPDLEKGMYGLGQFLGHFDYNLKKGHTDVWSNNITQVALEQREREDIAWLKSALKNADQFKFDGSERIDLSKLKFNISNDPADYKLTNTSTGEANKDGKEHNYDLAGIKDKNISLEDAKKWRLEYYTKRAEAIINKINGGLYDGSLTKSGEGTLVLTGDNDYDGKTTVAGGTLLAFSESIGTDHTVTVGDKGTFGVLSAYNDTFTQKGLLNSQNKDEDKLNIVIKDGGTLYIDGASDVKVQGVTFEGAKNVKFGLAGADHNKLIQVYNGEGSSVAGSFASDSALALEQSDLKKGEDFVDSLFFTVDSATLSTDKKKIEVSMKRDEGVTFQSFANGANQNSIASAIAASGNTLMGELLAASDKSQLEYVYSTLDDDFYVTARNALVTNATQVTRAVIDQASGMGEGRRAEFDEGRAHVWATGMGRWGEADGNAHSLDVDFTVGMVGAEFNVCQATKLGAFFGYGDTDYSGAQGKIDGEDKHFGIYGLTDIGNISMTYGIAYTDEDRDTTRHLGGVATSHSENASVLQGFVEGAYNFDLGVAKVSPYVGFTWARVETDDVVDGALDHNFKTEGVKDDIQIATIGARTSMPFTMGTMPVAVKADLGYSHFFGDSDGVARVQMGEGGQFATIEGSDLKGQVNFGLGIVGKVAKHATVGVSYTGAWGSDVDSHGIMGNLRINF